MKKYLNNKPLVLIILFIFSLLINYIVSSVYVKDAKDLSNIIGNYLKTYNRSGQWLLVVDEVTYELTADNLASGRGFSLPDTSGVLKPTMWREPAYPVFLSSLYILFGHSFKLVFFLQKVLLAFIVLIVYLIALNILEHKHRHIIAFLSAVLTAINLDLIYYSDLIMSETLFIFLLMSSTYLFIKALKSKRIILFALAGLLFGLSSLCRAVTSLYFIVAILLIIYFCKGIKLRYLLIFLIFYFSIITPWIARNYILFNTPSISSRMGPVLWIRTRKLDYENFDDLYKRIVFIFSKKLGEKIYPEYTTDYDYIFDKEVHDYIKYYEDLRKKLSEEEADKISVKYAFARIIKHPVKYVLTGIFEFINLNAFSVNAVFLNGIKSGILSISLRIVYKSLFLIAIPLFFMGLFSIRRYRLLLVLFSLIIYLNLFYSLFFGAGGCSGKRYVLPVVPFYLIFVLLGLESLLVRLKIIKDSKTYGKSIYT